jgi:succinate-semialdehyde dehydrogenase/glutarate-semialdehyde dehydrogenase
VKLVGQLSTVFDSINPATGETIGQYEEMSADALRHLLRQCTRAQSSWSDTPVAQRAEPMRALAELLRSRSDELAELMTREMGKPRGQAVAEAQKCALVCDYYAEHAAGFLAPDEVETDARHSFVSYRPLGLVLAVMPWNYPLWQVFRCAAPALMAGNGILLKHAPSVFGCALAIEKLMRDAGMSEHLFRSLILDIPLTTALIHDPLIAAVSVTASVRAGRAIAAEAGRALKKCVLELGGSDPFIVLHDADIDRAVEVGIASRYQNSAQSCIAAKRFIIVEEVYEQFAKKFVKAARSLKVGDPELEDTAIGPLARVDLRDALHDQVERSVEAGAHLILGGEIPEGPGAFYPVTVLGEVRPEMPAWREELFGPVAALIRAKNEQEAIEFANDSAFGLSASVWTRDLTRGERIANEELHTGAAFVNEMSKSDPRMPFGGVRDSGYGRELSIHGIREFVNVHSVWVNDA